MVDVVSVFFSLCLKSLAMTRTSAWSQHLTSNFIKLISSLLTSEENQKFFPERWSSRQSQNMTVLWRLKECWEKETLEGDKRKENSMGS